MSGSWPGDRWVLVRGPISNIWHRHSDVLSNAGSLVGATAVVSLLGFGYWALAARLFSQQAVGYGSAAVSAMTLLGAIGMLGLGTVLVGELPKRTTRGGLILASLVACGLGSLLLGVGFAIAAPHISARFANVTGSPRSAALFAVGVAVTAVSLVFDQATIGLMRAGIQLFRNIVFATAKLLVMFIAAISFHDLFGLGITASWVVGVGISLATVALWLRFTGAEVLPRPDWGVLRGLGRTAISHNWLNLAVILPFTVLPVLVTTIVSPQANAAFYIAWTLVGVLYMVPAQLSMVLFAIAAADPQAIARKLRFTMRLSCVIGLLGMAVLGLGAPLVLRIYGASYAHTAVFPLWMLLLGYLPSIPRAHYIAVCRAVNRVSWGAFVLSVASIAEVGGAAVGGVMGGLRGLSVALMAVTLVEGIAFTPPVLRAAMGCGRHRRSAAFIGSPANGSRGFGPVERPADRAARLGPRGDLRSIKPSPLTPGQVEIEIGERQSAGINALLSLATSVVPTGQPAVLPVGFDASTLPGRAAGLIRSSGQVEDAGLQDLPATVDARAEDRPGRRAGT